MLLSVFLYDARLVFVNKPLLVYPKTMKRKIFDNASQRVLLRELLDVNFSPSLLVDVGAVQVVPTVSFPRCFLACEALLSCRCLASASSLFEHDSVVVLYSIICFTFHQRCFTAR
jgi:hypothetical protein